MGSYPSADLHYGIDVGEWEWDADDGELTWWTRAAEDEHEYPSGAANAVLAEAGLAPIALAVYGDATGRHLVDYCVLSARSIGIRAYDPMVISPEQFVVDPVETENLTKAWALLFGPREHAEPAWVGTVSYG